MAGQFNNTFTHAPRFFPASNPPYLSNGTGGFTGSKPFSEETAKAIDEEVLRIIKEAHEEALNLLRRFRKELDMLATALISQETLDEQEILKVTGLPPAPPLEFKRAIHGYEEENSPL